MQPSLSKKTAAYTQTNKSTNTEQSRTPTMKMTGAQHRLVENHTVTQIRVQQTLICENLIKAQRFIIISRQPSLSFFLKQDYATQHCQRVVTQEPGGVIFDVSSNPGTSWEFYVSKSVIGSVVYHVANTEPIADDYLQR